VQQFTNCLRRKQVELTVNVDFVVSFVLAAATERTV